MDQTRTFRFNLNNEINRQAHGEHRASARNITPRPRGPVRFRGRYMKPENRITLMVDTREKLPWCFSNNVDVEVATLRQGDYSVAGFEDRIAIERKSIDDLVQSVTWQRDRFFRELERLSEYDFKCIFVEASMDDIAEHRYIGIAHPNGVMGTLQSIQLKSIPVIFACNRKWAALYAEGLLTKWAKRRMDMESESGRWEQSRYIGGE